MELNLLIGLTAVFLAVVSAGAVGSYFLFPKNQVNLRALMGSGARGLGTPAEERMRLRGDDTGKEFERLKQETKRRAQKKNKPPLEERLFHAGMFSEREKQDFQRLRLLAPVVCVPLFAAAGFSVSPAIALVGGLFGLAVGLQIPFSILDRRIAARSEDIMFYLPLVIEQIVIGVSSSLDVGPCLQRVVTMADERDSHNPVTELLRHAHHYVRSGISLEDALIEVAKRSGHTELKHSFMSLSQVARHGGEVTKQLQELADAVAMQREARIEGKIKKLELEATMPVALVFMGFLLIILIGFGLQVLKAFE